ncbi:MAG: aminotransferase class V-fold PLP-dependent enzyme [Pseudomonadota bacterium]
MKLDLNYVRSCFPAFQEEVGARTAFLENASGSYMVSHAINRLMAYSTVRVQPYGFNDILARAGEQMDAGKNGMAGMLGVPSDNVYFGPSTTQNINTLAIAAAKLMTPGSEIIVSEQEHEANAGAWERLCQRTGGKLTIWPINPATTELDLDQLKKLLNPKVRIVCVTHSSNVLGTINPIADIKALCSKQGARLVVDGVSYAPHNWPDLPNLNVDAYCFSAYKTFATHVGVMYVSSDFVGELDPQCHYFLTERQSKLMDAAGPDHASIAALAGLSDYMGESYLHHFGEDSMDLHNKTKRVYELMHTHEQNLCQLLLDGLQSLPLHVVGRSSMEGREANLAILSDTHSSDELSRMLAERGVAANYGNFYATRLMDALDINLQSGILRLSLSHYNSENDIERVVAALKDIH